MATYNPCSTFRIMSALTKYIEEILKKNYPQGDNVSSWVVSEPGSIDGVMLYGRVTNDYPLQHGDGIFFKYYIVTNKLYFYIKDVDKSTIAAIRTDIQAYFKKYPVI